MTSWRRMTSRSRHGLGTAGPPRPLQADTPVTWVTKVINAVGYRTSNGRFPKRENRSVTFGLWIDFQQTTSGGFHHLSSFEVKHLVSCLALNTTHNTRFLPNRPPSGWVLDSEEMKFWWPKSLQKVISVTVGVLSRRLPRPLAASDCRCGWCYAIVEGDRLLGELDSLSQRNRARRCRARRSSGQGAP